MRWKFVCGVAFAVIGACGGCREEAVGQGSSELDVTLHGLDGERVGSAKLTEGALGLIVHASLEGLPPGRHAFHVHDTGVCAPPFDTAGGHLTWPGTVHGFLSARGMHVGDLPNVYVPESGSVEVDAFVAGASLAERGEFLPLLDGDGSALLLHAGPDDYITDPSGNAGERIACGVITRR